jgi:HSP20 family molecular chaperone IbpA
MTKEFEENLGEFGIKIGPIGIGTLGPYRLVKYKQTEDANIIKIDLNPQVKKEQIKVRLVEPGVLEIEWPRMADKSEEIKIE